MLTLEEMLNEIEAKSGLSKTEIMNRIHSKQDELSGLVSLEGAAHLVARDLGIDLLKIKERTYSLKDVKPEMRNLNLKVRINSITPTREFKKKDGTIGKVCNLMVSDGTGGAKIPLWDKQTEIVESSLNIGDVIQLKNVSSRENSLGGLEIVLSKLSNITKIEDDSLLPSIQHLSKRLELKNVNEGSCVLKAMIVDVFNTSPIFYSCPTCKSKVEKIDDEYVCKEHGKIEPNINMVVTGVIDDGTGTIRSVFFRDAAVDITDLDPKTIASLPQEEAIKMIKENALGKEFLFKGRIQKNKIFETLEFVVDQVKELDVLEEINRIMNEISEMNE